MRARLTAVALAFAVLATLLAPRAAADAASPAGHWKGAIEVPTGRLEIDVDLVRAEGGGWSGDISIPAQGAKDLALADVSVTGAAVSFRMPGVPGDPKFAGELSADGATLAGTFSQGGATLRFSLSRGDSPAAAARQKLDGLDAVIEKALADFEAPGMGLAVVRGGEVVLAKGYGLRDREQKLPVTADTLFAIGSTTKAMTATLLGMLADEGKVAWDAPVRRYLPWFALKDAALSERLTVRDLVTHRSGLPRHDLLWYNFNEGTRRQLVERIAHLDLTADLREKFQYNNLMYATAGYLAGELSGTTWEALIRERLFAPLGMARTNVSVLDSERDPDHALPYTKRDGALVRIPFRRIDLVGPAGSVNSSAAEMARWLLFNLAGGRVGERQLVQRATLADAHAPHMVGSGQGDRREILPVGYGHGWGVDAYRGHRRVSHGGGIDGFITMVTLFPDDDLGIVSFVNAGVGLPDLVNNTIADRVLGLEPVDWIGQALARRKAAEAAGAEAEKKKASARVAGTKPSHPLVDYAGEYAHAGYGTVKVEAADAKQSSLAITINGIRTPLQHWHYDVWSGTKTDDPTFEDTKFLFRGDADGQIAALEARFDAQAPPVVFDKRPPARLFEPTALATFAGRYQFPNVAAEVTLAGSTLKLTLPGQPTYTLEPLVSGRFALKEAPIIQIEFVEAAGRVTQLRSHQPDGVYEAKRIE
jgi:CubicO group peptidase (beta-lactamase class C family)